MVSDVARECVINYLKKHSLPFSFIEYYNGENIEHFIDFEQEDERTQC